MLRTEMINIVGKEFLTSNIENDEFSYPKEFKRLGMNFIPVKSLRDNRKFEKIDIRFVKGNVSVLIETKVDFERDKIAEEQLSAYIKYEKQLTGNRIVAILANTSKDFKELLDFIKNKILPFINDKSTTGQDLLNLFFITFNKYVGKADKNQAFTPDHITDFMAKITSINKNTVVLDPCCGSGAFLVRAMTQALDDCSTKEEQEIVKKQHIFGIEYDENVYGLATTNMLIHGDGNSNIERESCFDLREWIKKANPDVILMNLPYNAQKKHLPDYYTNTWSADKKEDPTKGLYFVKYIADIINELGKQAKLAVLLPVSCAISSSSEIEDIKKELLKNNTSR